MGRRLGAERPSPRDPGSLSSAHARALEQARLRVAAGADPGDVASLGPRTVTTLRVATEAGAPLMAALDVAVAAEQDERRAARAVEVASAQGRAVAGGLLLAPLLLLPLASRLFGVDLVAYHGTAVGIVTGGTASALLVLGAAVARRAVASVSAPPTTTSLVVRRAKVVAAAALAALLVHPIAGLVLSVVLLRRTRTTTDPPHPATADAAELTATAVGGGWSVAAALRLTAAEVPPLAPALRRLAFDLEHGHTGGHHPPGVDRLADVLTTAAAVGAPVGPTLRRLAADVRADELARVLAAAERLPVRLTFPTALCLLPGTLLLIGAPIVTAGLGAVGT